MYKNSITFIQPRHSYASKEGFGHIYLPTPLLSMKARIIDALGDDGEVQFIDENLQNIHYKDLYGIVGINLLGAPYIPIAINMIEEIPEDTTVLLGGQIISTLSQQEFKDIFNKKRQNIFNGNDTKLVEQLLHLQEYSIRPMEEANLIKSYEDIPDYQMKQYLEREFSIYLSQGCKYSCKFCQAVHGTPEKYRNLGLLEKELAYLCNRAKSLGLDRLDFYLSNLDLLQTPSMFVKFLDILEKVEQQNPNIHISFRALCGIESFLKMYNQDKGQLVRAQKLGLCALGYGVDGATAEVRKLIGKTQNFKRGGTGKEHNSDQEKAIDTIKYTTELAIRPEVLMVFGHPGETKESIEAAYNFCKDMYEIYGATPRPHISKTIIPGTDEWKDSANKKIVDTFIENPEYFQALDYTALPSELTHLDEDLREIAKERYIKICDLTDLATKYIIPNTPHYQKLAQKQGITVEKLNEGKFDR